jgi:hypothetical protein
VSVEKSHASVGKLIDDLCKEEKAKVLGGER